MAKKASSPHKPAEKKSVLVYLSDAEYEGLRRYCFDERLKHSTFVRHVIAQELRRKSYLEKTESKE